MDERDVLVSFFAHSPVFTWAGGVVGKEHIMRCSV